MFVQTPKTEDGITRPGDCTSNAIAPFIDTLFVGTNLASALYISGQDNVANKGAAIAVGAAVASLWLSSAIYGFYFTSECKGLMEAGPQGSYQRVRVRRTVLSGLPAPLPPATPPPAYDEPAAAPAVNAGPAVPPAASQQRDDDDPLNSLHPRKIMAPK